MENPKPALWEITSLIGSLCSRAQGLIPAFLQIRYLQQQQVKYNNSSEPKFSSNMVGKQRRNIKWEVNFVTHKQNYNPNRCFSIGGQWTLQESRLHINLLELKAINLALLTFYKMFSLKAADFQVDNTAALSYLIKMGGLETGRWQLSSRKFIAEDHNYGRISAREIECESWLAVQEFSGFQQMVAVPQGVSNENSKLG